MEIRENNLISLFHIGCGHHRTNPYINLIRYFLLSSSMGKSSVDMILEEPIITLVYKLFEAYGEDVPDWDDLLNKIKDMYSTEAKNHPDKRREWARFWSRIASL